MTNHFSRMSHSMIRLLALGLLVLPVVAQDAADVRASGDAYAEKGEWTKALREYRRAVAIDPAKADYRARLGTALSAVGKSGEALAAFLEGLRIDPASSITYRSLGDHYLGLRYWDAANVSFQKAVELSPDDAEAHHGLGLALIGRKRLDQAAASFTVAGKLAPKDPKHVFRLGDVQAGQKKWQEAEASIRLAFEKSTDSAAKIRCVNSLGDIFIAQSRWADAAREYQKAVSLDPKDGRSLANLATAHYRRGARSQAWQMAHRAQSLGYVGPHVIFTELGIDLRSVTSRPTGIHRHQRVRSVDVDLLAAVESQDLERVRAALVAGASPNAQFKTGRAIEIAAAVGDAAMIEVLLDYGARGDAALSGGEAPLAIAVRSGNLEAVVALLAGGVDTECGPQGSALLTAIKERIGSDSVEIVSALVEAGADVDVSDKASGMTALMWAAGSDSAKLAQLLIAAGAKGGKKDKSERTAFDHAKKQGKGDTARYLAPFVFTAAPRVPADAIRLAPGGDLLDATRKAKSGQTIVLGAGNYSGPIDVRGKSLTIIGDSKGRTKIVAHPGGKPRVFRGGDPYVLVGKGGELNLWFLHFDSTPAGQVVVQVIDGGVFRISSSLFENIAKTAVTVASGQLFMADCRFENLSCATAVSLRKSTAVIRRTQFKTVKGTCIQTASQTVLSVAKSSFTQAKYGVRGFEQSTLRISNCEFSSVVQAVQGTDQILLCIRDSRFAEGALAFSNKAGRVVLKRNKLMTVKLAAKSNAIYLDGCKNILVTDNLIEGVVSGIVVRNSVGGPAELARNTIRRTHRALALVGKSQGKRPFARLTDNWLLGTASTESKGRFGMLLDGKMRVLVAENVVLQGFGSAVVLQDSASARFTGNLLSSFGSAIIFNKARASNSILTEELINGKVKTYLSGTGPLRGAATSRLETFMKWSPRAGRLRRAILSNSLAAGLPDRELRRFRGLINVERYAAAEEASQYGVVRLEVRDRVGRTGKIPFLVYDRQSRGSGHTVFTLDQVVDPAELVSKWKAEDLNSIEDPLDKLIEHSESSDKVLAYLRKNAHAVTRKLVAKHAVGSVPSEVLVLSIVSELNRFLGSNEFADDAKSKEDEHVASISNCWRGWQRVHAKGITDVEREQNKRTFNRQLLDYTFRFGVAQSGSITAKRTEQALPAGAYVLESGGYTGVSADVVFGPGLDATARVDVNDSLWITFDGKTRELLRLRPRHELQRSIGRLRFDWSHNGFAMRLAGADQASIANALELARQKLATLAGKRRYDAFYLPMRVLSAVGEAADVPRVLTACQKAATGASPWTFREKLAWAGVFSRIDAASGRLTAGSLITLLTDKNRDWAVAAAIELHRNGVGSGDDLLRDELSHSEGFARCSAAGLVLLDSVDPQTLVAMRALWDRVNRAEGLDLTGPAVTNPSLATCLYLLAFGDTTDWRRVSEFTLSAEHNRALLFLAKDPGGLMRRAAEDLNIWLGRSDLYYRLAEVLLDRTGTEAMRMLADFDRQSSSYIFEQKPETPRDSPYNTSRIYMSAFWPNRTVAANYARIGRWPPPTIPHPQFTWWKSERFVSDYVSRWLKGDYSYLDHLSYFSPELIAKAVVQQGGGKKPADYELYMAYLRVATRQHIHTYLSSAGYESRPYLAHHGSESGVSGVADLRFDWKGDALEIGVRLSQVHKFAGVALMEDPEPQRAHYPYIVNNGRKMIQSVTLRKGDKRIEAKATEKPDGSSFLLFEAPIGTRDLSGWYLDVQMKYVKQEFTLTTPLFFGENARRLKTAVGSLAN